MNDNTNALDVIPGTPHQPAPPKIEIVDYQEPTDPDTTPDEQPTKKRRTTITDLKQRLAHARDVAAVKRHDKQLRHVQAVSHRVTMANATEWAAAIERARRERTRDATGAAQLAELHRWAASEGERARIRADIERSAEMRALRIASVRRYTMRVGVPVMAGFAAISTPGVQKGMVNLLNLEAGSVYWWTAWAVEPLLIAVATSIIVVKSILKRSGGWTDWKADLAKWGALLFSVALNMLGGWTGGGDPVKAFGEALGHSVGALGAAVSAWLIGVIVDYASKAKPWDGVPRLKDLGLVPTVTRDAVTGELVTPTGDAPAVSDADARPAVTATVAETPAVTATGGSDAPTGDTGTVTPARRPSPSPRPTATIPATVTPAKRHTVTATVTPSPVTYKRVTVTTAPTVPVTDADATVTADGDVTPVSDADVSSATTATGKVRPLSRDLIDPRFRDWTVEQIRAHATDKAQQVLAAGRTKRDGMHAFLMTCFALGLDPKGTWIAEAVDGAQSAARGKVKPEFQAKLGALAVADAEKILLAEHNRIVAEIADGGDGRG